MRDGLRHTSCQSALRLDVKDSPRNDYRRESQFHNSLECKRYCFVQRPKVDRSTQRTRSPTPAIEQAFRRVHGHKTEGKQQAQCPQNEEKRPFVIGLVAAGAACWFQAQRGHCGQRTQWKVDPEDRAPAGILRHKAAGDWTYGACEREHRCEATLNTAALRGR